MEHLAKLSREQLLKLIDVYAKNWLAHDGCWFLAAEERYGMGTAMDLDAKAWERFAVAEAKRIMREFGIPPGGVCGPWSKLCSFGSTRQSIDRRLSGWMRER